MSHSMRVLTTATKLADAMKDVAKRGSSYTHDQVETWLELHGISEPREQQTVHSLAKDLATQTAAES